MALKKRKERGEVETKAAYAGPKIAEFGMIPYFGYAPTDFAMNPNIRKEDVAPMPLRTYIFDSLGKVESVPLFVLTSLSVLTTADGRTFDEFAKGHTSGIIFAYGFEDQGRVVRGLDIILFRQIPGSTNFMADSLTIEDGKAIPREKGILCAAEAIILGIESKALLESMVGSNGNVPAAMDIYGASDLSLSILREVPYLMALKDKDLKRP